ncbi:MAG: hypothetical protein PHR06_10865 [Candidatus Cloacimonetes bacterium]|nr:hypothetical protein [Candidatus Cloacimonadota bacterium]
MKKVLLIILITAITQLMLLGGEGEISNEGFSMGGAAGSISINGSNYTQIRLMPELTFGKFGIGLDIDLLIDPEGNIREEDWDDFEDYVNKILYVRYGHRGDPFYGKVGSFTDYTLGHGLVIGGYTNMLRYPEFRQIGLMLGVQLPPADMNIEAFSSNIYRNEILAGRISAAPLSFLDFPVLSKIRFGSTIATDRDQIKGLEDSDDDNYPDVFDDYPYDDNWYNEVDKNIEYWRSLYTEIIEKDGGVYTEEGFHEWFDNSENLYRNPSFDNFKEDEVTVVGLDYEVPLLEKDLFKLGHYAEYAQIIDSGYGFIFPGFYSKFLIFHAKLEFRFYGEDFEPSFFDQLYDQNRASAYKSLNTDSILVASVVTKEQSIQGINESQGWFGSLTSDLKLFTITVSYEDMYGDDITNGKSIWGIAALKPNLIPKVSVAELTYSQRRVENVLEDLKTPTTYITGKAGYAMGESTTLVAKYTERYIDLDGNGEIKGSDETLKSFGFGVEFRF